MKLFSFLIVAFCTSLSAAALPVDMNYFRVTLDAGDAFLEWSTSVEIDNAIFEVERSTDGDTWTLVGAAAGSGTSGGAFYDFRDATVLSGSSYFFRLKQVDLDGSVNYSEEKSISIPFSGGFGDEFRVYPSRVSNHYSIYVDGNDCPRCEMMLVAMDGREIFRKNLERVIELSDYNLLPGLYMLAVAGEDGPFVQRLVITD